MRLSLALLFVFAACGGSGSNSPDASGQSDAAAATVMAVTCPATVPLTVDAPDTDLRFVFTPSNSPLPVGSIVKFTMHNDHNVAPSLTGPTDPGLMVNFNETKCLMFTHTGTFGFRCVPHGFTGTITIQ